MCDICRRTPCAPTCPNADPPKIVGKCIHCGGEVFEGDEIYCFYDNYLHCSCASECKLEKVLDVLDEKITSPIGYFDDTPYLLLGLGFRYGRAEK